MPIHKPRTGSKDKDQAPCDDRAVMINPGAYLAYVKRQRLSLDRSALMLRAMVRAAQRGRVPARWAEIISPRGEEGGR